MLPVSHASSHARSFYNINMIRETDIHPSNVVVWDYCSLWTLLDFICRFSQLILPFSTLTLIFPLSACLSVCLWHFVMLGIKSKASHKLDKCSVTEPHPRPWIFSSLFYLFIFLWLSSVYCMKELDWSKWKRTPDGYIIQTVKFLNCDKGQKRHSTRCKEILT